MKFTSIPEAYSSFNDPLVYAFDTEGVARDVEITVTDAESGAKLGSKRLYGVAAGSVDIAPMLRRAARCTLPDSITECGEIDTGALVRAAVTIDGTSAPVRGYIAARVELGAAFTPLATQGTRRIMAPDEFDLLSFFSAPDAVAEVLIEAFGANYGYMTVTPPSGGQRCVAVVPRGFAETPDRMRATLRIDGEAVASVDYDIAENPPAACRLAWFDSQGAPELYTFPVCSRMTVRASRRRALSAGGGMETSVRSERVERLVSAYEPRAQRAALAEITASLRVWTVHGAELRETDVLTEEAAVSACGELESVMIDIRAVREEAEA